MSLSDLGPIPLPTRTSPPTPGRPLPLRVCGWLSRLMPGGRGGFHLARLARDLVRRSRRAGVFRNPDRLLLRLDLQTYPDFAMSCAMYEIDTLRLIRRFLRPGDVFVDAGANIGYFTLHGGRAVGPTGVVHAFEPDPINRRRLIEHLCWNQATNVRVWPVALGDRRQTLTLHHPQPRHGNHGQASLFAELTGESTPHEVPVAPLHELIEPPVRLIKLDIEGAELLAIRGMTRLLESDAPPMILYEHNPPTARAAGFSPGEIFGFFRSLDRRWKFRYVGRGDAPIDSPARLDDDPREINLLAWRD